MGAKVGRGGAVEVSGSPVDAVGNAPSTGEPQEVQNLEFGTKGFPQLVQNLISMFHFFVLGYK